MGLRSDRQYLTKIERDNGLRWDELHAFKDRVQLPDLPRSFPQERIPAESSWCLKRYDDLEICVNYGIQREHPKRPFERLSNCKHHWLHFERCVRRRDAAIDKAVKKWETEFTANLSPTEFKNYLTELDSKRRYHQYITTSTNSINGKFAEEKFFTAWDRIIAMKKGRGVPLGLDEEEREKQLKNRKIATLTSVTRTITNRLLLQRV